MAAEFPTSLHDFSATYADNTAQATTHPTVHNELNEECGAMQTKIGVDSSAVVTSLDYLLKNTSSSNPGHKHTLVDGATDVTASAAELNLNDTAVAGTAVASKTAVLGANKNLDEFHTAALYLGAGAGTQVTATAAELNKVDADTEWTSFVPAWNGITEGSATNSGYYMQIGKVVCVWAFIVFAADTSVTTTVTLTLPVNSSSNYPGTTPVGTVFVLDGATANYTGICTVSNANSTLLTPWVMNSSGTYCVTAGVDATTPITFGNTDGIKMSAVYYCA